MSFDVHVQQKPLWLNCGCSTLKAVHNTCNNTTPSIICIYTSTYQYHFSSYTTRVSIWWLININFVTLNYMHYNVNCIRSTIIIPVLYIVATGPSSSPISDWGEPHYNYDQQQNLSSCLLDTSSLIWLKAVKVRTKITPNMLTRTYE